MNYKERNLPKRDRQVLCPGLIFTHEHNFHSPALTTRGQQPDAAVTCLVQLVAPTWSERNLLDWGPPLWTCSMFIFSLFQQHQTGINRRAWKKIFCHCHKPVMWLSLLLLLPSSDAPSGRHREKKKINVKWKNTLIMYLYSDLYHQVIFHLTSAVLDCY